MKTVSGTMLISHGQLFDGTGAAPAPDAEMTQFRGLKNGGCELHPQAI